MPTTTPTTTTATSTYAPYHIINDGLFTDIEELETISTPAPQFTLQQNTHAIELRRLREQQSREVLLMDYKQPVFTVLSYQYAQLRSSIYELRRVLLAKNMYGETEEKHRPIVRNMFESIFSSRTLTAIFDIRMPITDSSAYNYYYDALQSYRTHRETFFTNRQRFGPAQALYNQQIARINQKPRTKTKLDTQQIITTLMQWDNIWGVSITVAEDIDTLKIRIGLCDITMSESAVESEYANPDDILLAPFYITMFIKSDSTLRCPASEGNAYGLSRRQAGQMEYDFHPHQLSDSPCFGSFGQTLIDMAHKGEIIPLVSGLIAFYSQYNSEDSAGITANEYHPFNLPSPSDPDEFEASLKRRVRRLGQFSKINEQKLADAMNRYTIYSEQKRNETPPTRANRMLCANCDEIDVSDGYDYWVSSGGDRICEVCWTEHFCGNCDSHNEDCVCEPDDEY